MKSAYIAMLAFALAGAGIAVAQLGPNPQTNPNPQSDPNPQPRPSGPIKPNSYTVFSAAGFSGATGAVMPVGTADGIKVEQLSPVLDSTGVHSAAERGLQAPSSVAPR